MPIGRVLPSLGESAVVFMTTGDLVPGLRVTAEDTPKVARLKGPLKALDVLAAEAVDAGATGGRPFLVATDGRRREVYWAAYDGGGGRIDGPYVAKPADVATEAPVAGRGARLYPEAFGNPVSPEYPDAGVLAAVVADERAELLDPEPLYLRRPDVAAPGRPKRVS